MEICVDSIESALNAVSGGAHRIQLCSTLSEGGLTPSLDLFKVLRNIVSIPIFVMLRLRSGVDYQYSDTEVKDILNDLTIFKDAKADGFVFGALTSNGDIDIVTCTSVILAARPLPVTFHRAFDVATVDPISMANKIADLGFTRLLTSGRCSSAIEGKLLIKSLVEALNSRLIIMPCVGITADNLKDILVTTLAKEFQASAKMLKLYINKQANELVYVTNCDLVKALLYVYLCNCKQQ